jgi:hypothetical protein
MLVDSKKQELSSESILMIAAQQTKSPYSPEQVYAALVKEMNTEGTSTYREGNTVFLMHHAKGRIGTFRALNADTARNYLDNSYIFIKDAYDMGFDVLVSDFKDPTIMNLFKGISRNPPREGMGYRAEKIKDGFRVTVKLGPARPDRE